MNTLISKDAKEAIDLAYRKHWRFEVRGVGEVPEEPLFKDGWWYEPASESTIPEGAQKVLKELKKAGISWKGVIEAREVPKALPTPADTPTDDQQDDQQEFPPIDSFTVAPHLEESLMGILGDMAMLAALFIMSFIDPATIIVLNDGTWLEVWSCLEY